MSETPGSPRASRLAAPSWLDGRLALGVLLVLVSVVVGARVLASADRSQLVWAATADLASGSQLGDGDLQAVRVRLFDSGSGYLDASGAKPSGYVLAQAVGRGELLPDRALRRPQADVDFRSVSVPVAAGHFPPGLRSGQKVDVWVTPGREPGTGPPAASPAPPAPDPTEVPLEGAQLVLPQLTTATGPSDNQGIASAAGQAVVLQVRPDDVSALLSAISLGSIDLVRVPRAAEAGAPPAQAAPGTG